MRGDSPIDAEYVYPPTPCNIFLDNLEGGKVNE